MIPDGVEDEDKCLSSCIAGLQQNAFFMHRALDSNNMKDALKYSAQMLSELRTSRLSPHKYYELYMRAFDELRRLEMFFWEESRRGSSIVELYELVQHAGNILPRLYLLCTVGSVYIKSKEGPAKDILKDLVELCRGIQHPLRGLFLRSYLCQISRDKLPDIGSEYQGDDETVMDSVEFVLQNFTEMNKLWVRMQYQVIECVISQRGGRSSTLRACMLQDYPLWKMARTSFINDELWYEEDNYTLDCGGPARDKEKKEKERSELRDLVGKNLHVLSQIEGVDLHLFRDTVLPRILEQVINCKDELGQYYLMDCVIQVFPDEYHLQTLDILLGAFPQLQPSIDIKLVLSSLMERLSNYATASTEALPEFLQVDAFSKLNNAIGKVVEAQADMPAFGIVTLYSSLLTFTLHVYPERLDYADQVLGSCVKRLSAMGKIDDGKAFKQIVSLLSAPLDKYNSVMTALKLSNYPRVMEFLDSTTAKVMATIIIKNIMNNSTHISMGDKVEALFELIKGLIKDTDASEEDEIDEEDFKEKQNSVARLIQLLHNDDPKEMLKIITIVQKHISTGGLKRLTFTVPPLVFSSLKLVRMLKNPEKGENEENGDMLKKIFQLLNQIIVALSDVPAPELSLRLYLLCAEAANDCNLEPVAYEFFTQAYILYEEEISDSRAQVTSLYLIVGTLQRTHVFGVENRDTLTHKATGYSAKLLKKPDQCRAVYACSHLFWADGPDGPRDGERVLLCLKRALRIANAAQQMSNVTRGSSGSVVLFVEILNKYLYFFEKGNAQITVGTIQDLIELIRTEMQSDNTITDPSANAFFASTLRYIEYQKQKGGSVSDKYQPLKF